MKVRLKLSSLQSGLCDYMFQFHEGPIKTVLWAVSGTILILFQFHEGPIKTVPPPHHRQAYPRFNSMKVRLKRGGRAQ